MMDAHCHLSFKAFNPDRDQVMERSATHLTAIVDCAVTAGTIRRSLELSENYDIVHSTLGIHPEKAGRSTHRDVEALRTLIQDNLDDIVALGEAGLDHHHSKDPGEHARQKEVFQVVIDMAREHDMPLVVHAREAEGEALDMVRKAGLEKVLFHCFGGDMTTASAITEEGYMISLATNVCYSEHHRGLAAGLPMGSILLETDSPYLSPRNEMKRNEPLNVLESAREVALIKGIPLQEVVAAATRNTRVFYGF